MKHYKEGRNHVIELGELSIKRIILNKKEYEELANYFAQQQVKNLNISDVSDSEKITQLIQIIEDIYINWEIETLDVYMKKHKDKIRNIIKSK